MDFHELGKFWAGKDAEGLDRFNIPLKPDEQGMVGRECPNERCETKYFKISLELPEDTLDSTADVSQMELVCPYCGTRLHTQEGHTEAQLEWLQSMIVKDFAQSFGEMLEETFRGSSYIRCEPGELPEVRSYVEEEIKQTITCAACQCRYAVYGISFNCPFCGGGAFSQHLAQGARTIRVLAEEAERIGTEHGHQVRDKMYGNAYEDVVSLFEGLLKVLYRYAVRKQFPEADAGKMFAKVKANFQRLSGAEVFFSRDLGIALLGSFSPKERTTLETVFAKRHVLTHNLGFVDEKYRDQVRTWKRPGAEVPLERREVLDALTLVEDAVRSAANSVGL
jgi:hypothetical protein